MRSRAARMAVLAGAGGYALLHRLGRIYGSTAAERNTTLPGDGIIVQPQVVCTHAVTIDARPEQVWPWLVQVGWHRAGWYTARWVDRLLFPANWPSSERLVPEFQTLTVGDFIPDGPPETGCGFTVVELQPAAHLVLHSTSHLPLIWRTRLGAGVDWTWVFILQPVGGRTRFIFRWRAVATPWWVRLLCTGVIVPADLLMSRDMLHGLKARAESESL